MQFQTDKIICVMDGACALCSFGARLIARFDQADQIRIATLQSEIGNALLKAANLEPGDPETWLLKDGNSIFVKADAVIYLARAMGGPARIILPIAWLPKSWRNGLYGIIARHRYQIFGRADLCAMPDPCLKRKLLD